MKKNNIKGKKNFWYNTDETHLLFFIFCFKIFWLLGMHEKFIYYFIQILWSKEVVIKIITYTNYI